MWYGKQLRRLHRARQIIKRQQQQLLDIELEGFIAITLHSVEHKLTVTIEHEVIMQAADLLREGLRNRRKQLKTDAMQLRQDWSESEILHARSAKNSKPNSPVSSIIS